MATASHFLSENCCLAQQNPKEVLHVEGKRKKKQILIEASKGKGKREVRKGVESESCAFTIFFASARAWLHIPCSYSFPNNSLSLVPRPLL